MASHPARPRSSTCSTPSPTRPPPCRRPRPGGRRRDLTSHSGSLTGLGRLLALHLFTASPTGLCSWSGEPGSLVGEVREFQTRAPGVPMSIDSAPADNSPEASPSPPTVVSLPAPSSRPWRRAGREDDQAKGEGSLRTFLGTAPGVGKTFAMLAEGRRRAGHGERVVAGWIEWHGRPDTRGQLGGLELIAPRRVAYRGTVFTDFDPGAAIASGAGVVLVDELAHTTADRTRQRWQDVADVLHAGLDVLTTMNVAHLRSVRDYAARITGVGSVACVPGEFVLVDLPADALRQRIASGAVYSAGQVGGALADYFRAANLRALSELARAWMAGTADAVGEDLLARRGLAEPPAPVVLAGDSGSSWGE